MGQLINLLEICLQRKLWEIRILKKFLKMSMYGNMEREFFPEWEKSQYFKAEMDK